MFADHRRGIAAGRGEMGGVRTEIDRRQPEDFSHLRRSFDDRRRDADGNAREGRAPFGDGDHFFQPVAKALEIVQHAIPVAALGAAADDEMFGAEFGSGVGGRCDFAHSSSSRMSAKMKLAPE